MVKSVKRCLRKSVERTTLTLEELSTLLTEVESVINARNLLMYMMILKAALTPYVLLIYSVEEELQARPVNFIMKLLAHRRL